MNTDAWPAHVADVIEKIINACQSLGLTGQKRMYDSSRDDQHNAQHAVAFVAKGTTVWLIPSPALYPSNPAKPRAWLINVSAVVDNPAPELLSRSMVGNLNRYASLLAVVLDNNKVAIGARLTIEAPETDLDAPVCESLSGLITLTAHAIWSALRLNVFLSRPSPNAIDFLTNTHTAPSSAPSSAPPSPSRWLGFTDEQCETEPQTKPHWFTQAKNRCAELGLQASADERGIYLQYRWGQSTDTFADLLMPLPTEDRDDDDVDDWYETDSPGHFIEADDQQAGISNIMIAIDEAHPLYGKGLFAQVSVGELPLPVDELAAFINDLNLHELATEELPPFFGGWCLDEWTCSTVFVSFIPAMMINDVYACVTPDRLLSWLIGRHETVKEMLSGYEVPGYEST